MGLQKGFTGLARITRALSDDIYFRFQNADMPREQGINSYLPSYGGKDLWRVISPGVGTINGRISLLLCEDQADELYSLARDYSEFTLDLCYYRKSSRTFLECHVKSLSFSCKAGEIVGVNMEIVATGDSKGTLSFRNTSTQKLVTWDKTGITGAAPSDTADDDIQSFSYNIENNVVPVRTANRLFPYEIKQGIQAVTGNVVWFDNVRERRITTTAEYNALDVTDATFRIGNLTIVHGIAHHWSYKTPLSVELVVTTLEWSRVEDIS